MIFSLSRSTSANLILPNTCAMSDGAPRLTVAKKRDVAGAAFSPLCSQLTGDFLDVRAQVRVQHHHLAGLAEVKNPNAPAATRAIVGTF